MRRIPSFHIRRGSQVFGLIAIWSCRCWYRGDGLTREEIWWSRKHELGVEIRFCRKCVCEVWNFQRRGWLCHFITDDLHRISSWNGLSNIYAEPCQVPGRDLSVRVVGRLSQSNKRWYTVIHDRRTDTSRYRRSTDCWREWPSLSLPMAIIHRKQDQTFYSRLSQSSPGCLRSNLGQGHYRSRTVPDTRSCSQKHHCEIINCPLHSRRIENSLRYSPSIHQSGCRLQDTRQRYEQDVCIPDLALYPFHSLATAPHSTA